MCDAVDGVDLSGEMLSRARGSNAYRSLAQADAVDFLRAATRDWNLVIAADVMIYIGALEPLFAAVRARLGARGIFCFSVESCDDAHEFVLRASLRYAHSRAYIERLAAAHAFEPAHVQAGAVREDQGKPIAGHFFWLRARP